MTFTPHQDLVCCLVLVVVAVLINYGGGVSSYDKRLGHAERLEFSDTSRTSEQSVKDGSSDQRFSFGFQKKQPTSAPSKAPGKHPPPLMSRQRELTMSRVFGGESDEEEDAGLAQLTDTKTYQI